MLKDSFTPTNVPMKGNTPATWKEMKQKAMAKNDLGEYTYFVSNQWFVSPYIKLNF